MVLHTPLSSRPSEHSGRRFAPPEHRLREREPGAMHPSDGWWTRRALTLHYEYVDTWVPDRRRAPSGMTTEWYVATENGN